MSISLFDHQKQAIKILKTGSILCGGVGSGKSRAALAYYFIKECDGTIESNGKGMFNPMKKPKDLFIITTARKRDTLEWEKECSIFMLSTKRELSISGIKVTVDSWNNIGKYENIKNSFFIFDEQRVVGAGSWVKSFLKITKVNPWILLSATPGDCWMDYVPAFVANGFYKNRTEFLRRHVVYNQYSKYPKIDRYLEVGRLENFKKQLLVHMDYSKSTIRHYETVLVQYDKERDKQIIGDRWNVFKNKPIKNASELCYTLRKNTNVDASRIEAVHKLIHKHDKIIIFYNFNYELDILRSVCEQNNVEYAEWNGHKHEPIPKTEQWVYLVHYTSGAEGWNCVETNVIVFYSQNYSYKIMEQAAGRIDRLNTPFKELYYYNIRSTSNIDIAILKSLKNKKNFNARNFYVASKT